jgi:hypothetical protein
VRLYDKSLKVVSSIPDEDIEISGVHSVSNRNEYQKQKNNCSRGVGQRPAHRADKLAAICEPIV